MIAIETKNLTKSFGSHRAVDRINLSIEQGEIYGFLGNNGAGKTTTIKMMTGLISPSEGSIKILGEELEKSKQVILKRVGCIVETPGFFGNLTGHENLQVYLRHSGTSKRKIIEETMELTGLDPKDMMLVRRYSLGMKQRLGIARALLNQPEILLLDEPTNGLDPSGIRGMRKLLRQLAKEQHMTLFLSSHILTEVEQLADRVGIIHHGNLIDEISMEGLRNQGSGYLEIQVDQPAEALRLLETEMGIFDFTVKADNCIEIFNAVDQVARINQMLVEHQVDVYQLNQKKQSLERHFIELTGGGTQL
ncbi:ABC transporter ATP-binding protein [Gottschalkiaceae bacterium SANA]|nr:ABC transporter ATP-binding protein [Gottschalkiaceae bacterium SANA]